MPVALLVSVLVLCLLSVPVLPDGVWEIEFVDTMKKDVGRDCTLQLDSHGYAHMVYVDLMQDLIMYAHEDGAGWHQEVIAESSPVCCGSRTTSFALDSSDVPHVCYIDRSNPYAHQLLYSHKNQLGWSHEVVDPDCGYGCSLALDVSDSPRIAYELAGDSPEGSLGYAWRSASGWQTEVVDPAANIDSGAIGIAIDQGDRPHISYAHSYCCSGSESAFDLKYAHRSASGWEVEILDSPSAVCRQTSIVVDNELYPRIAYFDHNSDDLRYAYKDASGWHYEIVDSSGNTGWYCSIALTSDQRPCISYYSYSDPASALMYAYRDSMGWHSEVADNSGYVGWSSSLVLDASDHPHISYYEWHYQYSLKYAYWDGAQWKAETVDRGGATGYWSSIAADSRGNPHVSFYDDSEQALMYARHDGSQWSIETVDNTGSVGEHTSLALDVDGLPNISYYDSSAEDLKYATRNGVDWHIETVDSIGNVGLATSIALDPDGRPHISYHDDTNGNLKYACHNGTDWHIETVDSGPNVGSYTSLALDGNGNPHIAYYAYDAGNGTSYRDLAYAYGDRSGWHIEIVDSDGMVGTCPSIVVDGMNRPHISYGDRTNGNLKYAHHNGAGWQIETVDDGPDVGGYTSLSLDAYGNPHVAYYAYDPGTGTSMIDLAYAYHDGTDWETELVHTNCDAGRYPSIAVTELGIRHISCQHVGAGALMYAWAGPQGSAASYRVDSIGNALADGVVNAAVFACDAADVAEWVMVSEAVMPGDVLALDPLTPSAYRLSQTICSSLVAGVVSTTPGVVLGENGTYGQRALLALTGIVPVKVTNESGPIRPGDLLVSSSTPGHAMRWSGPNPCSCALIGKALEPMTEETGVILVLLTAH